VFDIMYYHSETVMKYHSDKNVSSFITRVKYHHLSLGKLHEISLILSIHG